MTYFLIFLAVVVAAAAALYVVGLNKPQADAPVYDDALARPVANLPPVLLPDTPAPADVDRLRFSLGLRGYRMDQVDEVLDRLRDELAAKDLHIAGLEAGTSPAVTGYQGKPDAGQQPGAAPETAAVETSTAERTIVNVSTGENPATDAEPRGQ
ncbi:DivIVA domain-containing protein [Specibacter sp. AOP5-B1-6]|uniref:DivIVA domain-containing protein n=1 Tax=Specibacter sp. AOP5-B1-6 TaxID=3457653 RepID=UPI00402B47B7